MLLVTNDDVKLIARLDESVKRLYEARMQFLTTTQRELTDSTGIFDSLTDWDVLPPILFNRYRVWQDGIAHIDGITPQARRFLPRIPENVWSAIEGGRIIVTPSKLSVRPSRYYQSRISGGYLDYAHIEGNDGYPLEIERCTFENCTFWKCQFRNVHFIESDFLRSTFLGCSFFNCTLTDSFFDETKWGDEDNHTNEVINNVVNGTSSFRESSGIGPALFMPEPAIKIIANKVLRGETAEWEGEQLAEATKKRGWR